MMSELCTDIYPVVTLKEPRSVHRFVCRRVLITRRDDRVVLRFFILGAESIEFWGKPYDGELPSISEFQKTESFPLYVKYGLDLVAIEEFKRVLDFFDEPVNLKGLLPEKKVV